MPPAKRCCVNCRRTAAPVSDPLDFGAVKELAAAFAQTPAGRERARGLFPFTQAPDIRRALAETEETLRLAATTGRFPLSGVEDPSPSLRQLETSGGLGAPDEYRPLVTLCRAAERTGKIDAAAESFPQISRLLARLPDLAQIAREAGRIFAADGAVSDSASPGLLELRSRLRRGRQKLYAAGREWLLENGPAAAGDSVVLRQGRYCVPVSPAAATGIAGIVHDRSASGQTVFLEPLEMTRGNNELTLLDSDIRHEEQRILGEFGRLLLSCGARISLAFEILTDLDAISCRAELAGATEGVVPEFSEDGRWELAAMRHPLLDRRLANLRQDRLGETRAQDEDVPLDFSLVSPKRWLLVSGPNAGGKTVVLKTIGLCSMLAQAGFLLPAKRAVLPRVGKFFTLIGDDQSILDGLSSFSSAMKTLAEILREFDATSLALLDEFGGGTDPEEGGAIAAAALETLLARGGRAIVTTHLSAVKEFAARRPEATIAAMEFDEKTGHPTYRLRCGFLGRSRALATAQAQGLPPETLARAKELLGAAWSRREEREAEAEEALVKLRQREKELTEAVAAARREETKLRQEEEDLRRRRTELLAKGKESFEQARRQLRAVALDAAETVKREKLTASQTRSFLEEAERAAAENIPLDEADSAALESVRNLRPGDGVRLRSGQTAGRIAEIEGTRAWVQMRGKRILLPLADLVPQASSRTPAPDVVTVPERELTGGEINVIGKTVEEALEEVDRAIDRSLIMGQECLRVVHGHGTGRLRQGLRDFFKRHAAVASLRPGAAHEGGNGATIVTLK